MGMYMVQFAYTSQAWNALARNPEDREITFRGLAEKMGAKLISLHYCFGEYDGVVLIEAPDEATVMAIVVAAVSPGHVKAAKTTVLSTVQQALNALGRAGVATYHAPQG
ncbi:MAG TPA: GYD domain-containing protein [bacterium]|nr:GYD domain-containing protein [bacterium]